MTARSFYILTVLALLGLMSAGVGEAKPDGPFYPVKENGLWGYVNPSGSVVIESKFAHGEPFKHALARVKVGNLLAYLNKEGMVVWKAKQ